VDEPFKKLINQGMILGESAFVSRLGFVFEYKNSEDLIEDTPTSSEYYPTIFVSSNLSEENIIKKLSVIINENKVFETLNEQINSGLFKTLPRVFTYKFNADVSFVNISNELDEEAFKAWRPEFKDSHFITENDDSFKVSREVEKMSKSKYNVVNPDDICDQYGADTLRMYEMFLGPLEQAKPWNMAGITVVHSFLKKFWKLYCDDNGLVITDSPASNDSLKTLHKTIKKVEEDIENFSFNTSVSTFMIAVNELTAQKCNSREVLEPLAILISPYAPHIAEELWNKLGHSASISTAVFPEFDASYLVESTKEYPISFNGKMRFTMELPLDLSAAEIEKAVMVNEKTQQYLEGRRPKKVIIVPGKIVNIVG